MSLYITRLEFYNDNYFIDNSISEDKTMERDLVPETWRNGFRQNIHKTLVHGAIQFGERVCASYLGWPMKLPLQCRTTDLTNTDAGAVCVNATRAKWS